MLTISSTKYRKGHRRIEDVSTVAPPVPVGPPVLVAASYDPTALKLTLGFDRAIDVSRFDGSQVTANDGAYNLKAYSAANSPTLSDAMTVVIGLIEVSWTEVGDVFMNASPVTGIVAMDDGSAWAGVTDLVLPYSS